MLFVILIIVLIVLLAALAAVNRIQVDEVKSVGDSGEGLESSVEAVNSGNTRKFWVGIMPEEMRGVPYLLGSIRKKSIGPGLYIRFPGLYVIEGVIVQEQVIMVPQVKVSTKGGAIIGLNIAMTIKVPEPRDTLAHTREWLPVVVERVRLALADAFSGMSAETILSAEWRTEEGEDSQTVRRQAYVEKAIRESLDDMHVGVIKAVIDDVHVSETMQARLAQLDTQQSDMAADVARARNESELVELYLAAARKHLGRDEPRGGQEDDDEVRDYAKFLRRQATLEDLRAPIIQTPPE